MPARRQPIRLTGPTATVAAPIEPPTTSVTILDAVILGVVEGVTEYLPVSSTGHLILVARLLGLGGSDRASDIASVKEALDSFSIVIQGGAILAVAFLYWPRVVQMARGLGAALSGRLADEDGTRPGALLLRNLVLSFLPAAVIGLLLEPWIKRHLFHAWPVVGALAAGGVLLLVTARWQRRLHDAHRDAPDAGVHSLSALQALLVGFAQALAMWPGTSRSMVTILAGMLVGLPPKRAAEYSFLLGLPTLGGATIYELAKAWRTGAREAGSGWSGIEQLVLSNGGWLPSLVGLAVATISAAIAVRWLVSWLSRHSLELFGWWRLIVAALFATALVAGWIAS